MTLTIFNIEEFGYFLYARKFTLNELKEIHPVFMGLNSFKEFLEFLKDLSEIKKLSIKQKDNKLNIEFKVEYLLKEKTIEIELFHEKIQLELVIKELCNEIKIIKGKIKKDNKTELEKENKEIKKEIDFLKNENIKLKEEINQIKNILKPIHKKYQQKYSVIMNQNELDFIKSAIESRINKKIKKLKNYIRQKKMGMMLIFFIQNATILIIQLLLLKLKEIEDLEVLLAKFGIKKVILKKMKMPFYFH